jgi:uncharacterized SAM-binding protein YcdF (DUF218 family)
MSIPKFPSVPPLSAAQIRALTELVFRPDLTERTVPCYDLLFVFGGSHPEIWITAAHAYQQGIIKQVLITGGYKENATRHHTWTYARTPEAHVIRDKLVELGVPKEKMVWEDQSANSLENVRFGLQLVDVSRLSAILFVSKAYAVGRQHRTLTRHLPEGITLAAYPALTTIGKIPVTSWGWSRVSAHRAVVYGEYLRMVAYGKRGHLTPLEKEITGL